MHLSWTTPQIGLFSSNKRIPESLKGRPLFKEFETSGKFWPPNYQEQSRWGILHYTPANGLQLVIDDSPWKYSGRYGIQCDVFHGILSNGVICTLFECLAFVEGYYLRDQEYCRANIHAKYMVIGKYLSNMQDCCLSILSCQFTHLNNWFNNPYQIKYKRNFQKSLICFAPDKFQTELESNGVKFELEASCNAILPFRISDKGDNWKYDYCFYIRPEKPQNLQWFLSTTSLLRKCLIFLIGSGIYTLDLRIGFFPENETEEVSEPKFPIFQAIQIPSIMRTDDEYFSTYYDTVSKNISDILQLWFKRSDELKIVVDRYTQILLNDNLSEESLFLSIVQILEHFHGIQFPDESRYLPKLSWNSLIDNMKETISQILRKMEIEMTDKNENLAEILPNRIKSLNQLSFKSKLRQLFVGMPGRKLMPLLGNPDRWQDALEKFLTKVEATRHFLTHFDKEQRKRAMSTGEEIGDAISTCWAVLSFWLAHRIGFSDEAAGDIAFQAKKAMFLVNRKSLL